MDRQCHKRDFDEVLHQLEAEIAQRPAGYHTEIAVGETLFPAMATPKIEVMLLDPSDRTIAYRRISNPLHGAQRKGPWTVAGPDSAVRDAFRWIEAMWAVAKRFDQ